MTDETEDEAEVGGEAIEPDERLAKVEDGEDIDAGGNEANVDSGGDFDTEDHLSEIEDGAGCTEIWEFLTRRRIENDS